MLAEVVENDDLDTFFCAAFMWLRSNYKTLMQGKLKQKRQRRQKQLQRRHVYIYIYGFGYFPFPFFQQRYLSFLGPLDPQTLGRKELLPGHRIQFDSVSSQFFFGWNV